MGARRASWPGRGRELRRREPRAAAPAWPGSAAAFRLGRLLRLGLLRGGIGLLGLARRRLLRLGRLGLLRGRLGLLGLARSRALLRLACPGRRPSAAGRACSALAWPRAACRCLARVARCCFACRRRRAPLRRPALAARRACDGRARLGGPDARWATAAEHRRLSPRTARVAGAALRAARHRAGGRGDGVACDLDAGRRPAAHQRRPATERLGRQRAAPAAAAAAAAARRTAPNARAQHGLLEPDASGSPAARRASILRWRRDLVAERAAARALAQVPAQRRAAQRAAAQRSRAARGSPRTASRAPCGWRSATSRAWNTSAFTFSPRHARARARSRRGRRRRARRARAPRAGRRAGARRRASRSRRSWRALDLGRRGARSPASSSVVERAARGGRAAS